MSEPAKPPGPGSRFGTLEGYAQQTHELAAGMAEDLGVDLCDPDPAPAKLDATTKALVDAHRLYHDEAIRHGAICDGIHAGPDDEDDEEE